MDLKIGERIEGTCLGFVHRMHAAPKEAYATFLVHPHTAKYDYRMVLGSSVTTAYPKLNARRLHGRTSRGHNALADANHHKILNSPYKPMDLNLERAPINIANTRSPRKPTFCLLDSKPTWAYEDSATESIYAFQPVW